MSHFSILGQDSGCEQDQSSHESTTVASEFTQIATPTMPIASTPTQPYTALSISQLWDVQTPLEILEKMKNFALDELKKIEKKLNPTSAMTLREREIDAGGVDAELTAFEDLRWFVMVNDRENTYDSYDQHDMILKGKIFFKFWFLSAPFLLGLI